MANTQGTLPLLYRLGLRKNFRDRWVEYEPGFGKFLVTGSVDGPEIEASILTGPNRMLELGDLEPVDYDDLVMSGKVAAVDKEYGRGFFVSQRTVEDDKYGKAKSGVEWLAHAANMTKEYRAAAFLDDAFTGTYFKGYDGVAWLASTHTFLKAATGTWSNIASAPVGLSPAGLGALYDLAMQQKDHNGDPTKVMPNKLIIPNTNNAANIAIEIYKSALTPYTTENQDNALRVRFAETIVEPSIYMLSTKNYFLIDDKLNDAHFDMRRNPTVEDWIDKETRAYKFASTMRFMIYGIDPIGWYGANPT